jgi:hypothetical protein
MVVTSISTTTLLLLLLLLFFLAWLTITMQLSLSRPVTFLSQIVMCCAMQAPFTHAAVPRATALTGQHAAAAHSLPE